MSQGLTGSQGIVLTSGQVQSGHIGDGAVVSGSIASGSIGAMHLASGVGGGGGGPSVTSEISIDTSLVTNEMVSGGRAVYVNGSGYVAIAMAGVPARIPAIGVANVNTLSGQPITVIRDGRAFFGAPTSFSGYVGQPVWVGQSGEVVPVAPNFSGALQQRLGSSISVSGVMMRIGDVVQQGF